MEKQTKEAKKDWGGRREGAGRPRKYNNCKSIALRIPDDVEEILSRQENRSQFIVEAIRAYDKAQRTKTILGFEISITKEIPKKG